MMPVRSMLPAAPPCGTDTSTVTRRPALMTAVPSRPAPIDGETQTAATRDRPARRPGCRRRRRRRRPRIAGPRSRDRTTPADTDRRSRAAARTAAVAAAGVRTGTRSTPSPWTVRGHIAGRRARRRDDHAGVDVDDRHLEHGVLDRPLGAIGRAHDERVAGRRTDARRRAGRVARARHRRSGSRRVPPRWLCSAWPDSRAPRDSPRSCSARRSRRPARRRARGLPPSRGSRLHSRRTFHMSCEMKSTVLPSRSAGAAPRARGGGTPRRRPTALRRPARCRGCCGWRR